jgi:ABC-type multidrug transport system permease subunit
VFYREQAALMYDPYALGIATMLCEVPYVLAQVSIFVPIVYWMVGFEPTASKFFFYFLVVFVNLMMYTSFGLFLVMSTPMFEIAQLLNTGELRC